MKTIILEHLTKLMECPDNTISKKIELERCIRDVGGYIEESEYDAKIEELEDRIELEREYAYEEGEDEGKSGISDFLDELQSDIDDILADASDFSLCEDLKELKAKIQEKVREY